LTPDNSPKSVVNTIFLVPHFLVLPTSELYVGFRSSPFLSKNFSVVENVFYILLVFTLQNSDNPTLLPALLLTVRVLYRAPFPLAYFSLIHLFYHPILFSQGLSVNAVHPPYHPYDDQRPGLVLCPSFPPSGGFLVSPLQTSSPNSRLQIFPCFP